MKPAPYRLTPGWKMESSEVLASTEHLILERSVFHSPLRPEGRPWLVVRRKPAVVIVPQRADGKFVFIRQERPPVCRLMLEFPAGQVEEGEVGSGAYEAILRDTALRELEEETGYTTREPLEKIGTYFSSPGFTDEHETIFLARNVEEGTLAGGLGEHSEAICGLEFLDAGEVVMAIRDGKILDANSLAAWSFLSAGGYLAASAF